MLGEETGLTLPRPRVKGLENVAWSSSPVRDAAGAPEPTAAFVREGGAKPFLPEDGRWGPPGAGSEMRLHSRPNAARPRRGGARLRPLTGAALSAGVAAEVLISERPSVGTSG